MGAIEKKYNELRARAVELRALAGDEVASVSRQLACEYRQRVCERASSLAREAWPEVRARLAEAGEPLPEGPVRYSDTGGVITSCIVRHATGAMSVCGSRSPGEESTLARAMVEVRSEVGAEAERAEAAWERYRLAVAQGVAVEPVTASEFCSLCPDNLHGEGYSCHEY